MRFEILAFAALAPAGGPRGAAGAEGSGAEREQQLRVGHRDRGQAPGGHGAAAGHGQARAAQTGWYTCHVTTCQAPSCRTLDVPRPVYPFHSLNYFQTYKLTYDDTYNHTLKLPFPCTRYIHTLKLIILMLDICFL